MKTPISGGMGVLVWHNATVWRPRRDSNTRPLAPQLESLNPNTPYMSKDCQYLEYFPYLPPLTPTFPSIHNVIAVLTH